MVTGADALTIRAPRVHDRREGHRFSSYILPKYARRSPKVGDVLPVLYLRGLSTGGFAPALAEFFGSDAGLSATSIGRLLETWGDEYTAFESRDLSGSDFVYVWADGVHFRIRLEEDRLCCLDVIGVKSDGTRELLACPDGYRESTESWAGVLRDLKNRGMTAPVVAVGDGALGFWPALSDVFPETVEQRCWVHYVDFGIMRTSPLTGPDLADIDGISPLGVRHNPGSPALCEHTRRRGRSWSGAVCSAYGGLFANASAAQSSPSASGARSRVAALCRLPHRETGQPTRQRHPSRHNPEVDIMN